MVLMINQTLGKKRSYGKPTKRAPTLKRVHFVKKMDIVLKKKMDMAVTNVRQLLTNFLYLCFAFTLQNHLVPMLLKNFTYILNRRHLSRKKH